MPYQETSVQALREKRTSTLEIRDAVLTSSQWQDVLAAIKTHGSVTELALENIALTDQMCEELTTALAGQHNLVRLSVGDNAITEQGMHQLSQVIVCNTGLVRVNVGGNVLGERGAQWLAQALTGRTNLVELDLHSSYLHVAGIKQLVSIFKNNVQLERLHLNDNFIGLEACELLGQALAPHRQLKQLNLVDNEFGQEGLAFFLPVLNANKNTLDCLELGGNCLGVEGLRQIIPILNASYNWTVIDFGNSYLGPDESGSFMRELGNGIGRLKSLSLQNNRLGIKSTLTLYAVLGNNPQLEYLDFSGNQIGANSRPNADVLSLANVLNQRNTLKQLKLSNNLITSLALGSLVSVLEQNTGLESLSLNNNPLGAEAATTLANALSYVPGLTRLELDDCLIDNAAMSILAPALSKLSNLTELSLAGNILQTDGITALVNGLKNNKQLIRLELHDNRLNAQAVTALSPLLINNPNLQVFTIAENNVRLISAQTLATALANHKHLRKVSFPGITGPDAVVALAPIIANNLELNELTWSGLPMGPRGVIPLVNALKSHRQLTKITLRDNQLGGHGVANLVPVLLRNRNIYYIDLGNNLFGALGMQALAPAIKRLSLHSLIIDVARMGPVGAAALADALSEYKNLRALNLGDNWLYKDRSILSVFPIIQNNRQLRDLSLARVALNGIPSTDVNMLSLALVNHKLLRELDLSLNVISSNDLQPMGKVFNNNAFICCLSVSQNLLAKEGMMIVAGSLSNYRFLQKLNLDNNLNGDTWVKIITDALANTTSLTSFSLQNCGISAGNFTQVISVLSHSPELRSFSLGQNEIGDANMVLLTNALQQNRQIRDFDLQVARFNLTGLQSLKPLVNNNKNIVNFNTWFNPYGGSVYSTPQLEDGVIKTLTEILNSIPGLKSINFGYDQGGVQYEDVILALRRHDQLSLINAFHQHNPSDNITAAWSQYAAGDINLQSFTLTSGAMSTARVNAMLPIFSSPGIVTVGLGHSSMTLADFTRVIKAWSNIDNAYGITFLNEPTTLGEPAVRILCDALKNATQIAGLTLSNMGLTDAIWPQLAPVIQKNVAAELYYLVCNNFGCNNFSISLISFQQFIAPSNFFPSNYWNAFADTFEENNESTRVLDFSCVGNTNSSSTFSSTQSTSTTPMSFFTSSTRMNSESNTTNLLTSAPAATTILSSSFLMATFGFIAGVALMLVIMGGVWCYRKRQSKPEADNQAVEMNHLDNSSNQYSSARLAAPLDIPPGYVNSDPSFWTPKIQHQQQSNYQVGPPIHQPGVNIYDEHRLEDLNREIEEANVREAAAKQNKH